MPLVLDVREPAEFALAHIPGRSTCRAASWKAPATGATTTPCPRSPRRRQRPIVVVCRSGNRSLLAADVMQRMGYTDVVSLKTGVRGWNDFEQPLVDGGGREVDADTAEPLLAARVRPDQLRPR